MAFRVNPNPTFTTRAKIRVPAEGGYEDQELLARFRYRDDGDTPAITGRDGGVEFLRDVIVELDELYDDAGRKVVYEADIRDALLRRPEVRTGLIRAYFAAINGAALGN